MTTFGKLSKAERAKARAKLLRPALVFADPESMKHFEIGQTHELDLSDPDVCKFLYGQFWEDVMAPATSPEKSFAVRITKVDAEHGVIRCEAVK
jgi:hypothetical protein